MSRKLKIRCGQPRVGSTPTTGTKNPECDSVRDFYLFTFHYSLFTNLYCLPGFLEVKR